MSRTRGANVRKSALAVMLLIAGATSALAASTEADFKAAFSAAEAANKQAAGLRNQWTTTASTLAEAASRFCSSISYIRAFSMFMAVARLRCWLRSV